MIISLLKDLLDMNKLIHQFLKWLPIVISIVALLLSYFSFSLSQSVFKYEKNRDSFYNTPALKEIVDSTDVSFTLNTDESELQYIEIVFPSRITEETILINTKPISIGKIALEMYAQKILDKLITPKDSAVIVGEFSIPVMIDYSVIVHGFPYNLRENRFFIYKLYCDNYVEVKYSNSVLINRCGKPLKSHYFYKGPFSAPLEEKIEKYDKNDVQELLNNQFEILMQNFSTSISSSNIFTTLASPKVGGASE